MSLTLSVCIALCGLLLLLVSLRGRSGNHVTATLLADDGHDSHEQRTQYPDPVSAGRLRRDRARASGISASAFVLAHGLSVSWDYVPLMVVGGVGAMCGYLYISRREEQRVKRELRRMEFYLPSVMERIVMAVSSGFDIVPALREAGRDSSDPVSRLLVRVVDLSERGTPVDDAFEVVSKTCPSVSVKHALLHLGLAYRQGGEIVRPLKELSDATQLAYQENVEEQIAKLPVKAVLPLVLTFTGLIVCFLTVPLMQIGSITKKVTHVATQ